MDIDDKPKRTREVVKRSVNDLLFLTPIEFQSPLPIDECVRRFELKDHPGHSVTHLEIDLTQFRPNAYRFRLSRRLGRLYFDKRLAVDGTLEFWDEHTTLVRCYPAPRLPSFYLIGSVLLLVLLAGAISAWNIGQLDNPALRWADNMLFRGLASGLGVIAILALFIFLIGSYLFDRMNTVDEQRQLFNLVDDLLRDPVIYGTSTEVQPYTPFLPDEELPAHADNHSAREHQP